ncbi:hypothetical protein [Cupriavidus necator]
MNKFTMLVTAADVASERREGETMWQTKERLQKERKHDYLRQPWMPDFDAVRDKRMSELSEAQKVDAHELWLREQMHHMTPYYQEHLLFLLERLDKVREAAYGRDPDAKPIGYINEAMLRILRSGLTACTTISPGKTEHAQIPLYTDAEGEK